VSELPPTFDRAFYARERDKLHTNGYVEQLADADTWTLHACRETHAEQLQRMHQHALPADSLLRRMRYDGHLALHDVLAEAAIAREASEAALQLRRPADVLPARSQAGERRSIER
jgi:hypothetical protein